MASRPSLIAALVLPVSLALFSSGCTETLSVEVESEQKVSDTSGNFAGTLSNGDQFAASLTNLGDLEADGVTDLVAGAPYDDDGGTDRGAVWVLFMDSNGEVDISQKVSSDQGGFGGDLDNGDRFGAAVAGLGDINEDGFLDLAVGASGDDDAGPDTGAVWMLFMNADGTVRLRQKISNEQGGLGDNLNDDDQFGSALAALGDVDGDGVTDLAVGAPFSDDGGANRGAVWILLLNVDGTVKVAQKIAFEEGNFDGNLENGDRFGSALASVGDLDGDGRSELAVGTSGDDEGGTDRGAVWILFLNANGAVASEQKIAQGSGEFPATLSDGEQFGSALAGIGDMDGDGNNDLAVGAFQRDDGGTNRGAVWILFLRSDGTVHSASRISDTEGNFGGALDDDDQFGASLAQLVDLDEDGVRDIASGANLDDDGGTDRGAFWVLFMRSPTTDTDLDRDRDLFDYFGGR